MTIIMMLIALEQAIINFVRRTYYDGIKLERSAAVHRYRGQLGM
jgi:hypothetical protein